MPEYRMLKLGERIKDTDQFCSLNDKTWRPVNCCIGQKLEDTSVDYFRRKVSPSPPSSLGYK
jgi:hypothetical protein